MTTVPWMAFPRVQLGRWPTPLEEAPRLTNELGGPTVLVKRDDVNGLGVGGNKLRKLEFLLGQALADGADTVITFGALQTNHGRQTAAACAKLGLRCELVLTAKVPRSGEAYEQSGNIALDHLFGARVHVCASDAEAVATHGTLLDEAAAEGRTVSTIPVGGSNETGVLGYVAAAEELLGQLTERGTQGAVRIVVPHGSGGTAAGFALGTALLGQSRATAAIPERDTASPDPNAAHRERNTANSAPDTASPESTAANPDTDDANPGPNIRTLGPNVSSFRHDISSTRHDVPSLKLDVACVLASAADSRKIAEQLVAETAAKLEVAAPGLDHVVFADRTIGDGYGQPNAQTWRAIKMFAQTEGIVLDPVYTGKAAAALLDWVERGEIGPDEQVVFVHTGGLPGLYGYAPELVAAARP